MLPKTIIIKTLNISQIAKISCFGCNNIKNVAERWELFGGGGLSGIALREKFLYLEFFSYFPAFRLNTERYSVSLHYQSKCGKIRTRKTPNTVTFHAVLFTQCFSFSVSALHQWRLLFLLKSTEKLESCLLTAEEIFSN